MSCFNKLCSQNSPGDCSKNGENGFVLIMLSMKKLILLKAKILPWILLGFAEYTITQQNTHERDSLQSIHCKMAAGGTRVN